MGLISLMLMTVCGSAMISLFAPLIAFAAVGDVESVSNPSALGASALGASALTAPAGGAGVSANSGSADARGEENVIQIKSVVEVDGQRSEIVLGDLIVAHGISAAAMNAVAGVRLADTPKPGDSRSFTAMGLEQVFRQHLRDYEVRTGEKISLRIPTRVTVVRKSFRLKPQDVQNELTAQMKEFCGDCTFEISGLQLPAIPTTVTQGSSWSMKLRHEMPKGSFSLPLEVTNEDGSKRSYWITGSVTILKKVPVTARALQVGERVQPQDFTMQLKDVTYSNDTAANEAELTSNLIARQIAAGQILWRSFLRREMAVKNGDVVKVIAGEGDWQVMIDGIAQGAAYIGDLVNVKIPRTQKLLSGLLTAKGVVEVH